MVRHGSTSLSTSIWGFPKMVVPKNHWFSYSKMIILECWYQHLRKHPYILLYTIVWTKKSFLAYFHSPKSMAKGKKVPANNLFGFFVLKLVNWSFSPKLGAYQPLVSLKKAGYNPGNPLRNWRFWYPKLLKVGGLHLHHGCHSSTGSACASAWHPRSFHTSGGEKCWGKRGISKTSWFEGQNVETREALQHSNKQ